ncbi:MAG: RNA polymerase sigma factor [Candidatus Marinimicrobia bacterium]|nr:RNA polymerase sigma factor [Candidatus Neomarinimicrobiota bacterium]
MNTSELIANFLAGDISAFNVLVRQHQDDLFNFLLKYTGDGETAADLMQQTFILVYKKLDKLKEKEKFKSWLFTIAVNQCKNYFRKKREMTFTEVVSKQGIEISHSGEHCFSANDHSSNLIIKKALQTIPIEQRVVVIMKQYHGLKFTEIAAILNEPVNTIKARLYYGLNALRKEITKWGITKEDLGYEM